MHRVYSAWEVETNGITTSLGEWGEGDRVIVLLHGVSSNHKLWVELGPRLADAGWHVFAPDFRGSGNSSVADDQVGQEMDAYIDDLTAWTDAFGLDTFVLAGHSFGGRVAAEFAAQFPDRVTRLVLIDPAGPDNLTSITDQDPTLAEADEQGRQAMREKADLTGTTLEFLQTLAEASPAVPVTRARAEELLTNLDIDGQGCARYKGNLSSMLAQHWISRRYDQRPMLSRIEAETIVLRAEQSSGALSRAIPHYAELISKATFIDGVPGDHQLPIRNPQAIFDALTGRDGSG